MVNKADAVLFFPSERRIRVCSDHKNIVKFRKNEDPDYLTTVQHMKKWLTPPGESRCSHRKMEQPVWFQFSGLQS